MSTNFFNITPANKVIATISILGYLFSQVVQGFSTNLALLPPEVLNGKIWMMLTYPVVGGSILSVVVSIFFLFYLAGNVEEQMGTRSYVYFIVSCVVGGAVAALIASFVVSGPIVVVGISNLVWAVILSRAFLYPEEVLNLFGMVQLKAISLALIFIAVVLVQALFENPSKWALVGSIGTSYLLVNWPSWRFKFLSRRGAKKNIKKQKVKFSPKINVDEQ